MWARPLVSCRPSTMRQTLQLECTLPEPAQSWSARTAQTSGRFEYQAGSYVGYIKVNGCTCKVVKLPHILRCDKSVKLASNGDNPTGRSREESIVKEWLQKSNTNHC